MKSHLRKLFVRAHKSLTEVLLSLHLVEEALEEDAVVVDHGVVLLVLWLPA